ncbi:MAG: hypothetical protein WCO57_10590 [Verrucomicrobiota bacterium]
MPVIITLTAAKPRVLSPLERIELPTGASLGRVFARGWKGGRQRIVLSPAEGASYHIMSRTAGGERLLGDTEKEALRRTLQSHVEAHFRFLPPVFLRRTGLIGVSSNSAV